MLKAISPNTWIGIGLVIAVIGAILYNYGNSRILKNKQDPTGPRITLIAWFLLICGVMIAFAFFRAQYMQ